MKKLTMSVVAILMTVSIFANVGNPVKDKKVFEKGLMEFLKKKGGVIGKIQSLIKKKIKDPDCLFYRWSLEQEVVSEEDFITPCDNPIYFRIEHIITYCNDFITYEHDECLHTPEIVFDAKNWESQESALLVECPFID